MKRIKRGAVFFASGGIGYGVLELLWRGYTHWSMMLAGGICFVMFSHIAKRFQKRSLFCKALLCAAAITTVEFVFGVIFNLILKKNVWDYSNEPFNLLGQVCPLYTAFWVVLGLAFVPLAERINRKLNV